MEISQEESNRAFRLIYAAVVVPLLLLQVLWGTANSRFSDPAGYALMMIVLFMVSIPVSVPIFMVAFNSIRSAKRIKYAPALSAATAVGVLIAIDLFGMAIGAQMLPAWVSIVYYLITGAAVNWTVERIVKQAQSLEDDKWQPFYESLAGEQKA